MIKRYKNFLIRCLNLAVILALGVVFQNTMKHKEYEVASVEAKNSEIRKQNAAIEKAALQKENKAESIYIDGTYRGTAEGFGGEVEIEVIISGDEITEILLIKADGEDQTYLDMAVKVIDQMIDIQGIEVDTVSGATFSSKGIITATENALEEAVR
jgi:uncharacterized protein with FMN-binding domain